MGYTEEHCHIPTMQSTIAVKYHEEDGKLHIQHLGRFTFQQTVGFNFHVVLLVLQKGIHTHSWVVDILMEGPGASNTKAGERRSHVSATCTFPHG